MKNLIIITADQLKSSALAIYNEKGIDTPNIKTLLKDGVNYKNCYTTCPLCSPARVSLFTSTYPSTNGYRDNSKLMEGKINHSFKIWKENGFKTGLIGKNHCFGEFDYKNYFDFWNEISHVSGAKIFKSKGIKWFCGEDELLNAQKEYEKADRTNLHKEAILCEYDDKIHSTFAIGKQTEKIISRIKNEKFALWVSFPYPHEPYAVTKKYYDLAKGRFEMPDEFDEDFLKAMPDRMKILYEMLIVKNKEELQKVLTIYYANILMIDEAIGSIVNKLKKENIFKDTLIVFMSDHGEFAGEFNMMVKGGMFFDCLTKIPLIISNAGVIEECDDLVSLIDIIPTILEIQNIDIPINMQGRGLPKLTKSQPRNYVVSEYGAGGHLLNISDFYKLERPYDYDTIFETIVQREAEGRRKMIRTDKWKYIYDPLGDIDELYDLKNDKNEWVNLALDKKYSEIILNMKALLLEHSILHESGYTEKI